MDRTELIEWIIIIVSILAWWPYILIRGGMVAWGYPLWYHVLIHYVVPLILVLIFVRRYRRMKAGLDYSQQVVDTQRPGQPPLR
jgi:uncharacterized protein (DUF983 family)